MNYPTYKSYRINNNAFLENYKSRNISRYFKMFVYPMSIACVLFRCNINDIFLGNHGLVAATVKTSTASRIKLMLLTF